MESFTEQPKHQESALTEFGQALAYGALESPALAVAQLGGSSSASAVENFFGNIGIKAPEHNGAATTAGLALGSIADIMVLNAGVKRVFGSAVPDAAMLSREGAVGLTLKQAAVTGGLYSGVFSPSRANGNLLQDRLLNGITGATTFAGLAGTSLGLQRLSEADFAATGFLSPVLRNPISNGMLSGIPAGVFNTYAETAINQHRVATLGEVGKSTAEFSALGGLFGAADMYTRPRRLGPEVAVTLGGGFGDDGATGPESILRAQAAARLAKEHPNMKVILSGDGRPPELRATSPTEAQLMANILKENGVAGKRLLYEDQSMDTIGNAVLTAARFLKGQKPGKVYVVTSPFHAERAVLSFEGALGPQWKVQPVLSEVGYRDAVRGANESGGVDWTKRFYDGVTQGNLPSVIGRLNEVGKPIYKNLQWLQNLAKKDA